jgi:hypothetical protein
MNGARELPNPLALPGKMEAAPPAPTSLERIDVGELKQKLTAALKEKANLYWSCLRKFIQASIQKAEFDNQTKALLGSEHGTNPF